MAKEGLVYLIGAGPGDYDLLTIKAKKCIEYSDIIIYDRLVNPRILKYARPNAEYIYVGKKPKLHPVPQEDINEMLIRHAKLGLTVARLKGGDPFVFGRGAEEAQCLKEAGIAYQIIPGITSAVSVPAYAGIPVTHRDVSPSFHIYTGHQKDDNSPLDFEHIAKQKGTLIFLMGVKSLPNIVKELIANGMQKTTPIAVIQQGTTAYQKIVTGQLDNIIMRLKEAGINPPAIIIIGDVVNYHRELEWFGKGPLHGKRVLVTRARAQASSLVEQLEALGADVIEFPTIEIIEIADKKLIDITLKEIKNYTWVVFTSANSVLFFIKELARLGIDIRSLAGLKLCAIGPKTSQVLSSYGLMAEYQPQNFSAQGIVDGLMGRLTPDDNILLPTAQESFMTVCDALSQNGIRYLRMPIYQNIQAQPTPQILFDMMGDKAIDYITFTSSSTVNRFMSLAEGVFIKRVLNTPVISIGPSTTQTAIDHGFKDITTCQNFTIEDMVSEIITQVKERQIDK